MKSIDLILKCYGKDKFDSGFNIKKNKKFCAWYIKGLETKEDLLKIYSKKQIIQIYFSEI